MAVQLRRDTQQLAAAIRPGSQIKEGIRRLIRVGSLLGKNRRAPTSSMEATASGGRGVGERDEGGAEEWSQFLFFVEVTGYSVVGHRHRFD
jgi:hypothetical protein